MQEKTNVWIVLWVTVRMFLTLEEHTSVSGIKLWLFIHENGRRILNRTSEIQTRRPERSDSATPEDTHTHTFEMCGDFPYTITFILTKKYFLSPNLTENLFASFTNFNDFLFHRGDHRPVPTMSKMSGFTILFFFYTHTHTLTQTHPHRHTTETPTLTPTTQRHTTDTDTHKPPTHHSHTDHKTHTPHTHSTQTHSQTTTHTHTHSQRHTHTHTLTDTTHHTLTHRHSH